MRWPAALSILLVLVPPSFSADAYTLEQKRDVILDVWAAFDTMFYDPKMRGVDWVAVRDEMIQRAASTDLEPLIFEMIARLEEFAQRLSASVGSPGVLSLLALRVRAALRSRICHRSGEGEWLELR